MAMAAALVVLLLAAPAAYAVDHVVGGSNGWNTGVNYDTWASSQTFTVGDNLVFNYGGSHSVDQVSQADYTGCNTGNAIQTYTGGSNTVPLRSAGPIYFLCPTFGHCSQGMRLSVNVTAAGSTAPGGSPPSTTPSPPSGSGTPASPPPPRPSGAVGSLGGMSHLMAGLALAVAAVAA